MILTTEEILRKVRELEIKSKKITTHLFTGEYHSAFKGKGMSFREVLYLLSAPLTTLIRLE